MTKSAGEPGAIAEVAIGLPVAGTFHYAIPPRLRAQAGIGVRVQAPFGARKVVTGFILSLPDSSPEGVKLREIDDIPDPEPLFSARQIPFYRFIANYYFAPLGEVIRTALPAGLFRGSKQVLALSDAGHKARRNPIATAVDTKILEALAAGEELTLQVLHQRVDRDVNREVQRLLRWGWLEKRYRLSPLSAKRKMETCWRLPPNLSLEDAIGMLSRKAPKREAILTFLSEHGGWANLDEIKKQVNDPRPTLNLLVSGGLADGQDREVYRAVNGHLVEVQTDEVTLTGEQQLAYDRVGAAIDERRYQPFCLHGVTGSGKTEVYIRLTQKVLAAGRSAIVLVPEISLTPQFLGRFIGRLGDVVAPYHSSLSAAERYDQWRRMQRGEATVVVGARSGLFAPFDRVGLIVVDEEHETSFKQDDGVAYHARDLALKLATEHKCPVVLGSATPSVETYAAAREGRYELLELTTRPTGAAMPEIAVVDMRREMEHAKRQRKPKAEPPEGEDTGAKARSVTSARRVLSRALVEGLEHNLAAGEQSILFLNRRGYSTHAFCLECGAALECPDCDVALKYYATENRRASDRLVCHYCNHRERPPATCPKCASTLLFFGGLGTERVEEEVVKLLPEARVERLDRDMIRNSRDLHRTLEAFAAGRIDVLVGTQMVAKGHDFPNVTLVGIIDADSTLMLPDFRAAERAFALATQVSGRAGRADRPGRVVLQTFQPDHYAIRAAAEQDYGAFFTDEVSRRMRAGYPPARRLAVLRIAAKNEQIGQQARKLAERAARSAVTGEIAGAEILPTAPAMVQRIKGVHHWHMMIKADTAAGLHRLCNRLLTRLAGEELPGGTFRLDVDPTAIL
jgi:primosomal protein N' (replication factor Y) (superfamily II helicase)